MSLQVWLPLNGDLHNQGLSQVTVTNNGATVDNNGKIGKCYSVDGSHYINVTSKPWMSMKPANNFSLFLWVKGAVASWLIAAGGWELQLRPTFIKISLSGNGQYPAQYNATFDTSTWYHLGFTWDGTTGKLRLYLNGQNVASSDVPSTADFSVGNPLKLCYSGPYYLNDFRIYDHCLSPKEVEEIAKGLVLHYKLDDRFCEATTNLVTGLTSGGQTTVSNNIVTTSGTNADTYFTVNLSENIANGTQYTIQCYAEMPIGTTWTFPIGSQSNSSLSWILKPGYNEYTFTANDISWGTKRIFLDDLSGSARRSGVQCKFYNFQLEKKNHATGFAGYGATRSPTTVYDSSGYSNNGTIVGSLTAAAGSPRYDVATHLESSSPTTNNNTGLTYIQSPLSLTTPTQMSVCWWGHPESGYGGTSNHAAWCTSASSGDPTDYNRTAFHHRDAKFDICLNSASSTSLGLTFNNYTLNEWHQYCVTYDGKIAILYKDGIETNRSTISSAEAPLKTFTKIVIGFSKAGGVWRKTLGSYSDFRVYTTALTAAQVKELYNTSMSVDSNGNVYARELSEL